MPRRRTPRIPDSVVCTAVSIAARGAGWEVAAWMLRHSLPPGATLEQLRAEGLAHLDRERSA